MERALGDMQCDAMTLLNFLSNCRTKNDALYQMARGLEEKAGRVLDANRADLEQLKLRQRILVDTPAHLFGY